MRHPVNRPATQPAIQINQFRIWRKGLELTDSVQKMANRYSRSGSDEIWRKLRQMIHSVPSYLAEGFMMKNIGGGRAYLYRALNCMDELLESTIFTERIAGIRKGQIRRIKRDILELKSLLKAACLGNEDLLMNSS